MMTLFSSSSLQLALATTVYIVLELSTCSTKECRLQLSDKMKDRSVIFRNIDTDLCQRTCINDIFIFASCLKSNDESEKFGKTTCVRSRIHPNTPTKPCGSKLCKQTSRCLETGCGKKCVQAPSFTELHNASEAGDLSRVKLILSQGRVDINRKEWIGRTPVMLAAGKGHTGLVKLLVSEGADISLKDRFGINILHSACMGGDVEMVKYVLSRDMLDIDGKVRCGRTPMMLAAENGHRELVELLVSKGAHVIYVDDRRDNILHCACRGGHVEVVKYVLSQDMVGINSRGWKERTPIMLAAVNGHKDVVELLVSEGADTSLLSKKRYSLLHCACRGGHVEVVKYVLSQDMVGINSRGWKERTPIMLAAVNGHKDVVELLVSEGADTSLLSKKRYSLLHCACRGGQVEVVKYVLSQDMVDINSRGWKKRTPIMLAAVNGHKEVVELLLSEGADVSLVDEAGNNILHWASEGGDVEVIKYVRRCCGTK
ncbi:ankyrin repeat domain-containing protein 50-like [Haliotis cracherodii]|uniref:ankyrin repeat domain-containing protein 50-like n=1 Tax=Haliotis cracherodii TaxID=6455 RepID=UPI0039E81200